MRNGIIITISAFGLAFLGSKCTSRNKENMQDTLVKAPDCKKVPKELTIHGDTRIDNYYWLNERDNPEVINYLKAENQYTETQLEKTQGLQQKLYHEIIGRIKQDDESVPYKYNGYWYTTRFEEGKEYPIYIRQKETLEAKEEVLLDVNKMAEGHEYYQVGGLSISMDNRWLSYGVDNVSRRIYTVYFKNLETGELLSDSLKGTSGSSTWANDNKTIFYTQKDEQTLRSHKIFKHKLGTPQSEDQEIYHEEDEAFSTYVFKSKSKEYIFIGCGSTVSSEYRYISANNPDTDFKILFERERDHEYSVSHFEDNFYICTNKDAKNFKLVKTPVNQPSMDNWEEVIPHRDDVLLEGIEIFKEFLVAEERKNGLTELAITNWKTGEQHYLDFGEPAYSSYVGTNPDFNSTTLRYGYTSMTTPSSAFDYDMNKRTKKLLKQQEVIGSFNKDNYQSERIMVEARDGEKVPVSIVYKKGTRDNGPSNLLLYSYGSYGHSMDPYFSSSRLSLLDRGFVFAIAHIRGGEEMGRRWYEDGKLLNKKNTFNDYIDCAKHLIDQKYTSPEKLFAMGGSAGGLLMGVVINEAPELFKGAVAQVPFVDVVTTMLDESIPLTTGEFDEWGNPKEKDYYNYMKSYSPYDNVEAHDYPNLLVTTGLHDSQVQYWEPAKWVAKLRDLKTDSNKLLLKTDMETGHGGASGRFKAHHETALEYAFLLNLAGISE